MRKTKGEPRVPHASTPPIVLVHGLWLTPRSWEGWKARFERRSGHLQQFGDAALCDAGSRSGRGSIARTEARQTPPSPWRSERRAVLARTSARRPKKQRYPRRRRLPLAQGKQAQRAPYGNLRDQLKGGDSDLLWQRDTHLGTYARPARAMAQKIAPAR